MLVLTRYPNEDILIGDITIKIVSVRGKKVRVGITAPKDVRIYRPEVIEKKKAEGEHDEDRKELQS
jgi:carbon storage regulator